ncbi:ATP-binding protein [Streptomyces sp. XM4193]|uniref:AAA family ATPase n=1 Tax=Streptomyces sp. XM4193 TaxID=2929782 RepID=UPI001FF8F908|nr:AAA family ATPase [Streptomyces sp. XM4193]MCK1796691.1 ATP-binding protein [Streptomyces sp. XM4193]
MLLWINGPYGGGKTQTAHELHRRLPGSVVCDPEEVGYGLHRMTPPALREDFQHLPAWRSGVFEVLDLVLRKQREEGRPGPVIAPMTVYEPRYFRETVGRLREAGHDVRHFGLLAERGTVLDRLSGRGLGRVLGRQRALQRESWAVDRLDLCVERLREPEFHEQLWTDGLTVSTVAERLAAAAGLELAPDTASPVRASLRRGWTSLKHIRRV